MNRRSFLRLVSMGVVGAELDIEWLLWIPKTMITVPAMRMGPGITMSQIIEAELRVVLPHIAKLFEMNDPFYKMMKQMDEK